jgi:hypothetical protein
MPCPCSAAPAAAVVNIHGGYRPSFTGWHLFHTLKCVCTGGLWLAGYTPPYVVWKMNHPGR